MMLRDLGATDVEHALGRAALQGRLETAKTLHAMLGNPPPPPGALGGRAYTLNVTGTEFLFHAGARVYDDDGKILAPVDVVLCSDSRRPASKHRILEIYVGIFIIPSCSVRATLQNFPLVDRRVT